MADLTGQIIKGYELHEQIGVGGFGAVYRAHQSAVDRDVAIKIILPQYADDPEFIRRFEAEAQVVARLEHPYIVPLYDYWRDPSGAYLVMRWLPGGSLAEALKFSPLLPDACLRLLEQVGAALAVAHRRGVIHRDLKPGNILLDDDHNAYLTDFGIAKRIGGAAPQEATGTGMLMGSPAYIAPEQIREEPVSPQTDIYSLGVVLYEVLTGIRAFRDPTPYELIARHLREPVPLMHTQWPDIPATIDLVVQRATAKHPEDRYPDVMSLVRDFRQALGMAPARPEVRPALPTGTVTFLFADIDGSTARWEQHPVEMRVALDRHNAILRQAVAAAQGGVVQTGSEGVAAAFPTPQAALTAGLAAQRALQAAAWPAAIAPLRVRMALDTGLAEERDDGYHAEYTLNRLARLLATGHGGQILASEEARRALLAGGLPAGVQLRDLGLHELRDISEPVPVFQVLAEDLPGEFPPLRTSQQIIATLPLDAVAVAPAVAPPNVLTVTPTPTGVPLENPYKGLRAFQEADTADFFGREALTARLLARLAEPDDAARFLAVVGPSGSGKSSVVRAGLVPALRRGGLPGSAGWFIVELIPGAHPMEELEAALLRVAVNPPASLLEQLQADERGLTRAVKRVLPGGDDTELVLVIDQFEELFTLVEDEDARAQFLTSLAVAMCDPRSRLRVIVTLRADFYDRPLLYPALGELMRQRTEVVLPLAADELERAIAHPAERVGVALEPGLLAAMVREVGEQPGALPLLQYALTELFERRVGRVLTLAAYEESGGVLGALACRAEELYESLDEAGQEIVRQVFLRLVTLGTGTEDTRRRVCRSELSSMVGDERALARVLDTFNRYRLLTFDRDPQTREPTVEVAHEALIRTWDRLREWLTTSRTALQVQRQLLAATNEWLAAGRETSFLATGARLAQFETLLAPEESASIALTADESAYLQASLAERDQQRAAERERQAHELALARQAAESAQQAAAAQRSAAGRLRILVGAMGLFLVLAIALTAFALSQRDAAAHNAADAQANAALAQRNEKQAQDNATLAQQNEKQAQTNAALAQANFTHSEALRLGIEATDLIQGGGDPELAALLGVRSIRGQYTSQGDAAVTAASILELPLRYFSGHKGSAQGVAFSPDGKLLLSGSSDVSARLWDVATGRQILSVTHQSLVWDVAFAPDGKTILTTSADQTARLWNPATGQEVRRFTGHTAAVISGEFSHNGKWVLTGSEDKTARLWDAASGALLRTFAGHTDQVNAVRFAPDDQTILTVDADGSACLWATSTGAKIRCFTDQGTLFDGAFAPDGKAVLLGAAKGRVALLDVATGKEIRRFEGHGDNVIGVAFSPDGTQALTSSVDKTARLWDVASGKELRRFTGILGGGLRVAFSRDGQFLAVGAQDYQVRLYDARHRPGLPQFIGHTAGLQSAVFSPDGKYVFSTSGDGTARLWDAASGQELRQFLGHTDGLALGAFAPDGKTVLTGGFDKTARLWDVTTGTTLQTLRGDTDVVYAVAFSPDGKQIATGSWDYSMRLWDVASGQQIRQFNGHTRSLYSVAFSPDGKELVTGSADATMRVWDVATGKELRKVERVDPVISAVFSADGKYLLSGGFDKSVHLWDAATLTEVRSFPPTGDVVLSVAFSPDGKTALAASQDGTARIWDLATGQELRRFTGHAAGLDMAQFSPDGKYVLTASDDMTMRLWDTDYQATVRYICAHLQRDFTDAERTEFSLADKNSTCPNQ